MIRLNLTEKCQREVVALFNELSKHPLVNKSALIEEVEATLLTDVMACALSRTKYTGSFVEILGRHATKTGVPALFSVSSKDFVIEVRDPEAGKCPACEETNEISKEGEVRTCGYCGTRWTEVLTISQQVLIGC